jgi:arylsulfatase A-like enzyme
MIRNLAPALLVPALLICACALAASLADSKPAYAPDEQDLARLQKVRQLAAEGPLFIIFMDAAAAYHYGCYGYHRDTSPNLDAFARDGVLFERAIVPYPNTYHSFWSITSSRWSRPAETAAQPLFLRPGPPADPTNSFASLLKLKGYFTLAASANGFAVQSWRGYDVVERVFAPPAEAKGAQDHYRCPAFYPLVQRWLEAYQKPGSKLFFWLHYIEPHAPYTTPPPFNTRFTPNDPKASFGMGAYDNNISFVDHELGRLFQLLKERGLYEAATIVLTADHGEAWGEHGTLFHNTGVHDEEARVPLLIKFPQGAPLEKRRVAAPVSLLDLLPTIADLFDVECDKSRWSGQSFLPLVFTRQPKTHEYVFCRAGADPEEDLWRQRLGLPPLPAPAQQGQAERKPNDFYSIRDERYLLTWQRAGGAVKLYDMLLDPGEKLDLAQRKPELRERMLAVLKQWREEAAPFLQEMARKLEAERGKVNPSP